MEKTKVSAPRLPALCHHKPTGQAYVRLGGKQVYLGKFGTPAAEDAYRQLMAQYVAAGHQWDAAPRRSSRLTVGELGERYSEHAAAVYTKRERETTTAAKARRVAALLGEFGATDDAAADFGPVRLHEFQAWLVTRGEHVRKTINEYVRTVVSMYRWATSRELLPESCWRSLSSVPELRRGRAPAPGVAKPREGSKVTGVSPAALEATRAAASPTIRAMIDLQLVTGMRPGEVVAIRPADLIPTNDPNVVAYRVREDVNKTDHFDISRVVYLGPRARALLDAFAPADPLDHYFDPRRAEEHRNRRRSAARRTPKYPSHDPARRAARRRFHGGAVATHGDCYRVDSYRRAIWRACDRAMPHPTLGKINPRRLTELQRAELEAWREEHRWSPHQLRHSAATAIARAEKLDVAKLMLGHSDIQTTLRYIDPDVGEAMAAATRWG